MQHHRIFIGDDHVNRQPWPVDGEGVTLFDLERFSHQADK